MTILNNGFLKNPIGKKKFYFLISLCLLLGIALRGYLIVNEEYSINSSYSTHAKTALHYKWVKEVLPNQTCKWYSQKDLYDKFYKLNPPIFSYGKLYQELEKSNHPPLYYFIAHLLHSLNKNGEPAFNLLYWLNLFFSLVAMVLFFLILSEILTDRFFIIIGMFWYCTSFSLAAFVLFHKAYELQLLLSLFIVWITIRQNKKEKLSFKDYFIYTFLCFMLLLTHYLSYIFIFILCIWICIINVYFKKQTQRLTNYAICTAIATIAALLLFPFSVYDILVHGYNTYKHTYKEPTVSIGYKLVAIGNQFFQKLITWPILLSILLTLTFSKIKIKKNLLKTYIFRHREIFLFSLFCVAYFLLLLISRGSNPKLRYGFIYIPYFIILVVFFISYSKRTATLPLLISLFVLLSFNLYSLYRAHTGKIPSDVVVHRWHNQPLYPQNILNNNAIFVTGDGSVEHIRPYIYHSEFQKTAILTNEFCPEIFSDLKQTTVIIDKLSPSKNYDEIINYIKTNQLELIYCTDEFEFYKATCE